MDPAKNLREDKTKGSGKVMIEYVTWAISILFNYFIICIKYILKYFIICIRDIFCMIVLYYYTRSLGTLTIVIIYPLWDLHSSEKTNVFLYLMHVVFLQVILVLFCTVASVFNNMPCFLDSVCYDLFSNKK